MGKWINKTVKTFAVFMIACMLFISGDLDVQAKETYTSGIDINADAEDIDKMSTYGWKWKKSSKVLTLDGANILINNASNSSRAVAMLGGTTLRVEGDSTITIKGDANAIGLNAYDVTIKGPYSGGPTTLTIISDGYGICSGTLGQTKGSLTIDKNVIVKIESHHTCVEAGETLTVNGTLNLENKNSENNYGYSVIQANDLIVNSGASVTGKTLTGSNSYGAIYVKNDMTVNGGTVNVTSVDGHGIYALGELTIDSGEISAAASTVKPEIYGITVGEKMTINGGKVTALSNNKAISNWTFGKTVFPQAYQWKNASNANYVNSDENPLNDYSKMTEYLSVEAIPIVSAPTADVESGTYKENQTVELTSATEGATIYYTLDGTEPTTNSAVYSDKISINGTNNQSQTITLKAFAIKDGMASSSVVTYEYTIDMTPVNKHIDEIIITNVGAPIPGERFDGMHGIDSEGVAFAMNDKRISWSPGIPDDTYADYNTSYTASAHVVAETGYVIDENTKAVFIERKTGIRYPATIRYRETGIFPNSWRVSCTFPATAKAKLLSIITPEAISGVANGTLLENIELPSEVSIETEGNVLTSAPVTWDKETFNSGSYDPTILTEQTFVLNGTVTIPEGSGEQEIDLNNVSLSTTISVTVAAAGITGVPIASPVGGTYTENQTIALTTSTEGAAIYYTFDGSEPTTESNVYTGPITIEGEAGSTVKKTLTAIAVKEGMQDSSLCVEEYIIEIPMPTYTVTLESNGFGTVSGKVAADDGSVSALNEDNSFNAKEGDIIELTASPNDGYEFKEWVSDVEIENNRFTMPASDVEITAIFEKSEESTEDSKESGESEESTEDSKESGEDEESTEDSKESQSDSESKETDESKEPNLPGETQHSHEYDSWKYDNDNHWKTCECGQILDGTYEKHEWIRVPEKDTDLKYAYTCECGAEGTSNKQVSESKESSETNSETSESKVESSNKETEKKEDVESPSTGDKSPIYLCMIIAACSMIIMSGIIISKTKSK